MFEPTAIQFPIKPKNIKSTNQHNDAPNTYNRAAYG